MLYKTLSAAVYGVNANVIRILVPLTAADRTVDDGLDMLEQAMRMAA